MNESHAIFNVHTLHFPCAFITYKILVGIATVYWIIIRISYRRRQSYYSTIVGCWQWKLKGLRDARNTSNHQVTAYYNKKANSVFCMQ